MNADTAHTQDTPHASNIETKTEAIPPHETPLTQVAASEGEPTTKQQDQSSTENRRKPRWYKRPRYFIPLILLVLILSFSAALGALLLYLTANVRHVDVDIKPPSGGLQVEHSTDATPLNFLVLGSDSRKSGGDPNNWEYGAQRSDTMLVVHISGDRKNITAMSIPRDSWVEIPGKGPAKINAAFSWGGANLTIETVQSLLGIHIDHFAVVDFEGFKRITDLLGGVTINTTQGAQTMTGEQALAFVRERKSLPNGDFDRVRRQQAWIRAIMSSVKEQSILKNPDKLVKLADIMLTHSAVDQTLDLLTLMQLAGSLRPAAGGDITFFTAPVLGTGWSPDGTQSIVNLNGPLVQELGKAWAADTLTEFLQEHPEIKQLGDESVN